MSTPCQTLVANQKDKGEFISHATAKPLLENYLKCKGEIQPDKLDTAHIYGYVYGLKQVRELIDRIGRHNDVEGNVKIDAIRIYRSKSKRNSTDVTEFSDLLLVPVQESGVDYPASLNLLTEEDMILSGSGPCPNVCNHLFFNNEKS